MLTVLLLLAQTAAAPPGLLWRRRLWSARHDGAPHPL